MRLLLALTLSAALVSRCTAIDTKLALGDLDLLTFWSLTPRTRLTLSFLHPFAQLGAVLASKPVQNLQVTLRGKKYDVSDVETVGDLQNSIQEASGLASNQQGRVLFDGKRLEPSDILRDVGVSDGAQLNLVPATTTTKKSKPKKSATAAASTVSTSASSGGGGGSTEDKLKDLMKQAGMDGGQLDEIMKGMGGGDGEMPSLDEMMKSMGGADGEMPSMQESMQSMTEMMSSPIFQEYMSDPEKLEQSRQMILGNPMMKSMMAGMPGMEDILNDPDAWREAMTAAANLYKSMDGTQLMDAMMGSMGGAGGSPGAGLFDGNLDNSAAAAALDELDEDD